MFFRWILLTSLTIPIYVSPTCIIDRNGEVDRPNYGYVWLSHMNCENTSLPLAESFSDCQNCMIEILRIRTLQTQSIPPIAFDNAHLYDIEKLFMDNLHISYISVGAFSSLEHLTELHLSNNNITELSEGIFNSLHKLEVLDLAHSRISNVSRYFLTGTNNLKSLNLSFNLLSRFDGSILHSVYPISIDLSFNSLTSFSFNGTIAKIGYLNLSHNNLQDVVGCCSENKIFTNVGSSIQTMICQKFYSALQHLNLAYNSITSIKFISSLKSLEYLFLEHNFITTISHDFSEYLPNLLFLNLSFNGLSKIEFGGFDNLEHVTSLDLSNNELTTLSRCLHALKRLKDLYLDDNKLNNLNGQDFFLDIPEVTIHIDKNRFLCEDLVDFFRIFEKGNRFVTRGTTRTTSNVHGIACLETNKDADLKKKFEDLLLEKFATTIGNRSSVFEYLNRDFRNSSFYKYLEGLQNQHSLRFNETELVNYFNKDFKNSSFYQYLESLKDPKVSSVNFNTTFFEYFNKDFKNSSFVKYLEDLKRANQLLNGGFNNSLMYSFFNGNFVNSNFYKYLDSFNKHNNVIETNALTETSSSTLGVLCLNSFFLFVITVAVSLLVVFKLRPEYFYCKRKDVTPENVALCER